MTVHRTSRSTRTTTANGGYYEFTDLNPNLTYMVEFVEPSGSDFATPDQGDDTTDSDADQATGFSGPIDLTPGEFNSTIDAGLVPETAGLGDYVWEDNDNDGQQGDPVLEPGVDGVTVNLWTDDDGDGIADTQIDTTTTANGGYYEFTGLDPDLTYVVEFVEPSGSDFATPDQGDDTTDSDADQATGFSGPIDLAPSEFNSTIDAGLIPLGSIGNTVWEDSDNDGFLNNGETGIGGVLVNLLDGDGNYITSQTTDGSGYYLFDDLPEGDYIVEIDSSNFDPGAVLDGYVQSTDQSDSPLDGANRMDPWGVALGVGEDYILADFGYFIQSVGGGEGCTPGYWKQPHHFDSWTNYTPSDEYDVIFGVPYDKTLLEALRTGGGGEKALGRHATAGLLNAAHLEHQLCLHRSADHRHGAGCLRQRYVRADQGSPGCREREWLSG